MNGNFEMQNVPLEKNIIFGPIHSRRLGRSLGLNLMPIGAKRCSFDCVYCFFGSNEQVSDEASANRLPTFKEVTNAIDIAISDIAKGSLNVDFITLAGNGEPALHPHYSEIVDYLLKKLRTSQYKIGTAIFTNGSRLDEKNILSATARLDKAVVKIDLVDKDGFQQVNRPQPGIELENTAKYASKLPNLIVQTAVMKINGKIYNDSTLEYYCSLLRRSAPKETQLYNIIYPPAEYGIETVTTEELEEVADKVRLISGLHVVTYNEVEAD